MEIVWGAGGETTAEGLKNLALAFRRGPVSDNDFYDIFLEQVSPEQLNDFRSTYETFHGGRILE